MYGVTALDLTRKPELLHPANASWRPGEAAHRLPSPAAGPGLIEDFLAFSLLFLVYSLMGGYIATVKVYLPGDALSRMTSAYLVFNGTEAKLATIGFVWPPISTLLMLPFVLFQTLVDSWMAVVLISAAFAAASAVVVGHLSAACGLSSGWRRLLVLLFACNPLMVIFAINGMSESIMIFVVLAGFHCLLRYWRTMGTADLTVAGCLFGLLPLIRYEMALVTLAVGGLVALRNVGLETADGSRVGPGFRSGPFLAYGVLAAYPLFLWALANWEIMGSPLYFLANDRSALSVATVGPQGVLVSRRGGGGGYWYWYTLTLWLGTFPAWAPISILAVAVGFWRRSCFLLSVVLLPLSIPLLQGFLLTRQSGLPLVRYFVMVVPFSYVLLLIAILHMRGMSASASARTDGRARGAMAVMALLLAISNVGSASTVVHHEYQDIEGRTWTALVTPEKPNDQNVLEAMEIGRRVSRQFPAGTKILLDEYGSGFAILLGSGNPKLFMDHTHPRYQDALSWPPGFVDYILVPSLADRGALDSINRAHPDLYSGGVQWAQLVDELPQTVNGWRLFKVKRQQRP